ncbi:MAG: hypothetical protein A3B96_03050 [Candidatus Spechtbacteria bacterium RIFCSPHIGHO2_02_FULL_43_15b]|uniref:Uncharacterized protein n=1 Tax=Candidatus Spechtbacteria bacterium RIFCSPHIGHO2_01_FULL_43_30 TaxID=1802158 RepID=A0A1G2H9Z9_9BACT|nr:MAG: hypothetical protein A2827_00600 [Candidatus Spechtbacteria bacterium RIFCSPHIGHO2_01_FULL_43_30]OGZ59723.1 MAG: hypothetical protein A3B96_03050 [Candidatus Spechtbacteria bacterium RIFCSPHIGHO2_02_FULL_43_15b]
MKSRQVLSATENTISALLGLHWRRVSSERSDPRQFDIINTQRFEFYKQDGALACTVEFRNFVGCLFARSGKILDSNGAVIIEDGYLTDADANPKEHPLNDLYDIVWNKESGEPFLVEGKFSETIKLENFREGLRA